MSDNQRKILEMLANKDISIDEAHRLLSVLEPGGRTPGGTPEAEATAKAKPKYLRVTVQPGPEHEHDDDAERVNVRVPMSLIRSGMRFTSVLPPEARDKINGALLEKGMDFDMRNLKPEDLDQIIEALSDLEVNVESGKEVVRVFVE